jgi:hypothetical protein
VTTSSCGRCTARAAAGIGGCAPNPDGEVQDQAHTHPVRAESVTDAGTVVEVTLAYATKYADSPYVQSLLSEEAAGATLRLEPRR